jgi:hypothetical protein
MVTFREGVLITGLEFCLLGNSGSSFLNRSTSGGYYPIEQPSLVSSCFSNNVLIYDFAYLLLCDYRFYKSKFFVLFLSYLTKISGKFFFLTILLSVKHNFTSHIGFLLSLFFCQLSFSCGLLRVFASLYLHLFL